MRVAPIEKGSKYTCVGVISFEGTSVPLRPRLDTVNGQYEFNLFF